MSCYYQINNEYATSKLYSQHVVSQTNTDENLASELPERIAKAIGLNNLCVIELKNGGSTQTAI